MHPTPLRDLDQAARRRSVGHRFGQSHDFVLRDELIAGRKQFWQHDEVGLCLFKGCRDRVEILGDFAKLRLVLIKSYPHLPFQNSNGQGEAPARCALRPLLGTSTYFTSDKCMTALSAALVATSACPALP